jgi:hypothetical protein
MDKLYIGIILVFSSIFILFYAISEIKKTYSKTGPAGKSAIIGYAFFGLFMFLIGLIYVFKNV